MNVFDDLIHIDYKKGMGISNVTDGFFAVYLYNLYKKENKNILVVVNSLYDANRIYYALSNFMSDVYLFPMDDFLTSEAIAISPDLKITRLETINEIVSKKGIIITNTMGYLRYMPSKKDYLDSFINLKVGNEIDSNLLISKLINMGYSKESIVTNTGEVGVRGFVIDIFPIGYDNPIRIELFGDEIESIREFDFNNQRSIKSIKEVIIKPFTEFITDKEFDINIIDKQKYLSDYNNVVNISDYLDSHITVYKDYEEIKLGITNILEQIDSYHKEKDTDYKGKYMFNLDDINEKDYMYSMGLNNKSNYIKDIVNYDIRTINNFNENPDAIIEYFRNMTSNNKTIIICLGKKMNVRAIKKLNYPINENGIKKGKVNLIEQDINEGFIYNDYIFLSSNELFKVNNKERKYKTKYKYSSKIKDLNSLKIGDYVVHNAHGIGVYNGIKVITSNGISKDYLEVLYYGTDKLYIPVEKIDLLYKFVSKDGVVPKINKMDSLEWKKTKARVKQKISDMADKLIKLYSEREHNKGFAFSKDNLLQKQFEEDCLFTLTTDQDVAVKQIKEDMENSSPMDRLLCGDVGFGKTEVAFRATFKAILDSKQVLFLCPTTILSNQHYENAKERFKNFPVNIALLNRFTTTKEVKRIKEGLLDGTIDLVFGTHRLLSDDIKLKDLGLLVIDEEQRFGVIHKEKIKEYKTNVDVLTLTATPIPRTLQMSMAGIRSLSLIETPPVNRYPIQTYVVEESNELIKDAINKELSRGGQTYILFNSIERIEDKVRELQKLVPNANIDYAHGQMTKIALENKMNDFINNEFNVLVCTTIIETGIDIANVNTLIILDSDRFGLSQLYQIRGRVGRSDKFAYAYLMYNPKKMLTDTAKKRLNVIKEFTELGSGFSIATRDLSIRGAGDILGSEQAGFIDTIGIDLYLKLLDDEVNKKKGIEQDDKEIDEKPVINVATHIDNNYVDDEGIKIEIHKKINEIDSSSKLKEVKEEIEDRFGKINEEILIYMYEEWFEKQVNIAKVEKVNQTKNYIELVFVDLNKNIDELFVKASKISPMFRFKSKNNKIIIVLDIIKLEKHPIYYLTELLDYIIK